MIQFWCFWLGIFNDGQPDNKDYFFIMYYLQLLGLTLERLSVRWLTDRFGCNYFRLQKFIELDWRREAVRYNMQKKRPLY